MLRQMLRAKIHRATVTDANLEYEGSLTVDPELLDAAGILQYEQVSVSNLNNGERFETYVIPGKRGSGEIEGLAILQHPSSRWAPSPWFTRDYGFMSPTPMYWPPDGKVTKLAKGEKVMLRYRVFVFSGDPAQLNLARQ